MNTSTEKRGTRRSPIPALARALLAVMVTAFALVALTPATGEGFTRGYNLIALYFVTSAAVWLIALLLLAALGWTAWRARNWRALWPQHRFALLSVGAGALFPLLCGLLIRFKG